MTIKIPRNPKSRYPENIPADVHFVAKANLIPWTVVLKWDLDVYNEELSHLRKHGTPRLQGSDKNSDDIKKADIHSRMNFALQTAMQNRERRKKEDGTDNN